MAEANKGRDTHKGLRVLFVDDERSLQEFMRSELPRLGHEVTVCPDGHAALKVLQKGTFDAAILDLRMPGLSGIDVLQQLKQITPDTEAVVMTGHASLETSVEALRLGAFDYITKPCKLEEIKAILYRIAEKRELQHKNIALETRVQAAEGPTVLIGKSPAMAPIQSMIDTVGPTDATVLILGETGTGKDVVARAIWKKSKRASMPFVPVNCGALAEHLVESQLFGHRKGAFTGADRDHKGFFEVANGGTLFLDEMGELNKNIQVKLLRFLESGEVCRLGDNEPFRLDVRILCATNRNIEQMIQEEAFREDLYFRINTFELYLPPLNERRPDIPSLARHLLAREARRPLEQVEDLLTPEAIDVLLEHDWQGNVRELANMMEYAYIVAGGKPITPEHLRSKVSRSRPSHPGTLKMPAAAIEKPSAPAADSGSRTLQEMEMDMILRVLEKHKGSKATAAQELGISLKTLYNKLNKLEEERRSAG